MRAGAAGIKALAPPVDLFEDFGREKSLLLAAGTAASEAHVGAFGRTHYRERFMRAMRGEASQVALRMIVDQARTVDLFLMCMCPYRAVGESCHTYLLLELARELEPTLTMLPEPRVSRV